jgi:hypothetical protein
MSKILSITFVAAFLILFVSTFVFAACYLIATIAMNLIRLFKPSFGRLAVSEPIDTRVSSKEIKLTAIDYLMQEKLRRAREQKARMEELLNPKKSATEWSLPSLNEAVKAATPKPIPQERKDRWALAKFPVGSRSPYWLVGKMPTREKGLKVAFAPVKSHRLTMSLDAAQRWADVIPDAVIFPASAAARQVLRLEALKRSEHATA